MAQISKKWDLHIVQNPKQWKHATHQHNLTHHRLTKQCVNHSNLNAIWSVRKSTSWACSEVDMMNEDSFYDKLNKLNEPSGLSLLFNFRDARMDLQQLYKYVTEQGGYQQVTKVGKWEDIASGLNPKNRIPLTPCQVQKLYATILYPFEQIYHYRCPVKHSKTPITHDIPLEPRVSNSFRGKWKHDDRFDAAQDELSDQDTLSKKKEYNQGSPKTYPVCMVQENNPLLETPDKVQEMKKAPRVPLGSRTSYQIYTKMECERLRRIHGESMLLRDTVVEAWRHLSHDDKQPYIEASKKDKERFIREMVTYEEHMRQKGKLPHISTKKVMNYSSPTFVNFAMPSQDTTGGSRKTSRHYAKKEKVANFRTSGFLPSDGDYHVALKSDDGHETARVSNESTVQLAIGLMKDARPNDPIFQIDWEAYGGLINITPR